MVYLMAWRTASIDNAASDLASFLTKSVFSSPVTMILAVGSSTIQDFPGHTLKVMSEKGHFWVGLVFFFFFFFSLLDIKHYIIIAYIKILSLI